jgi:ribonuclease-3
VSDASEIAAAVAAPTASLEARLGHRFRDPTLLETALTHASRAREQDGGRGNERLEFLGDAVLDLAVGQLLYAAHPEWGEGHLTRARAALVNARALAERARSLELGEHVRLGRTERRGGAHKQSILANVLEAVIGALYLDGGFDAVVDLVEREFGEALASGEAMVARDPKTRFQEWAHAECGESPRYRDVEDSGVEGADDRFTVAVLLHDDVWGEGVGRTKRHAEREAARRALERAGPEDD